MRLSHSQVEPALFKVACNRMFPYIFNLSAVTALECGYRTQVEPTLVRYRTHTVECGVPSKRGYSRLAIHRNVSGTTTVCILLYLVLTWCERKSTYARITRIVVFTSYSNLVLVLKLLLLLLLLFLLLLLLLLLLPLLSLHQIVLSTQRHQQYTQRPS